MRVRSVTLDKFLRVRRLTTEEFARKMRVAVPTVSKWRQRKRIPRPEHMKRIRLLSRGRVDYRDWY